MTNEQKKWLDEHPDYEPVGVTGGFGGHQKRGTLKPDGTFVPASVHPIQAGQTDGAFPVGQRVVREPENGFKPRRL